MSKHGRLSPAPGPLTLIKRLRKPDRLGRPRAASASHADGRLSLGDARAPLSKCPPAAQRPSWQVLASEGHRRLCTARQTTPGACTGPQSSACRRAWGVLWFCVSSACFFFLLCSVCCSGKQRAQIPESGWWKLCLCRVCLGLLQCSPALRTGWIEVILPEPVAREPQTWGPANRVPSGSQRPAARAPWAAQTRTAFWAGDGSRPTVVQAV